MQGNPQKPYLAKKMINLMPATLARRLAPGTADTLGISICRIFALPSVEIFILLGVGPSIVTTVSAGFFFVGLAAYILGDGTWAALGIGLGALLDYTDGMVARRTQRASRVGYQYDYVMDRAKSSGLFLAVAFIQSSPLVRVAALAALALLITREFVTWLAPIRRSPLMGAQSPWHVVFGRWHRLAEETLRNDPWQLVILGAAIVAWPSGVWIPLAYYFLTLLVDSLVFFRTFMNFGRLHDPRHPQLLYWGAEGRMKTSVAKAFRRMGAGYVMMKGALSLLLALSRRPLLTYRVLAQINAALRGKSTGLPVPMQAAADWLLVSQVSCPDGLGYSRRFRVAFGWDRGYIETTGYIIPTMLSVAVRLGDDRYRKSALSAGEWLLERQNIDGSFSEIDHHTPQAFDTGQVLIGLNALCRELPSRNDYRQAAVRAACWLVQKMDADGSWSRESFRGRPHSYYARSGAALLESGLLFGRKDWIVAAERNLDWVLAQQRESGWFEKCEFEEGCSALLHTIVYVMEGLLMAHSLKENEAYYNAALRSARGLLAAAAQTPSGIPAAYYERDWRQCSKELCVTGLAQWAGVCGRLNRLGGSKEFEVSRQRCLQLLGAMQIRVPGALHGSLPNVVPWWGSYGKMGAYNWNVKFYIDALLEQ